jgi:Kelch motif/Galactose oxidase, central domain
MRIAMMVLAACGSPTPHPVAMLVTPRASHAATLLADGTVLVTGGFRKGPDGYAQLYAGTTEVFVPTTGAVVPGPDLLQPRCGHATATLADGSLLIVGGWNAGGVMGSAELLDRDRRGFVAAGALATARGGLTATHLANDHVLVIGGSDDRRSLASIEELDPRTRSWRTVGSLAVPRTGHTATLLADGRVLVIGGESAPHTVVASAEIFDPASGVSTPTGSLAVRRYKHGAVTLANGDVLVVAGSDERDWRGKSATTEIYDVRAGRFRAGPALAAERFKLPNAVLRLPDGDIVIAGGAATIERVRSTSRIIGSLGAASYYGTATLLPSGELVVIGGYDDRVQTSSAIWRIAI